MSHVYTDTGDPIDTLAVAADDSLLTIVARLDLLDDDSLSWLAKRCLAHADETKEDRPKMSEFFVALVRAIEEVQADT